MNPTNRRGTRAALVLADGTAFLGQGLGASGVAVGELVFNTAMTGYQEILTDPSYAGQLITFTFPHIGNVGTNAEDIEATNCHARGVVLRALVAEPSNFRAAQHLDHWLEARGLVGIAGVDTRRITRRLRDTGAQAAALAFTRDGDPDLAQLTGMARAAPGMEGMDLASEVSCRQRYAWDETIWRYPHGYGRLQHGRHHVVAVDYGIKRNILRSLASLDLRVTVVPATTSAEEVLALEPDGIFLSNGPGDPAATGRFAVPQIQKLLASGKPLFGICLGHQMLALALGGTTEKMKFGHHGANHPVKDLTTGKVEITSQNHGFAVRPDSLPAAVEQTHLSLFDGSLEGLTVRDRPVFSVQYHPEASPGPQDSAYLFERFLRLIEKSK
jgi:carbamoyl-phosphate synthase small subunit